MAEGRPKVLFVDTSYPLNATAFEAFSAQALDYSVYSSVPSWWRRLERFLRLDIYLALRARRIAGQFDVVFAGSERAAIPLAFMFLRRPIVTLVYNIGSPLKSRLLRLFRVPQAWSRVGYLTDADRKLMLHLYGYPGHRLFRYVSAPLDSFAPSAPVYNGPILSTGVAGRDYETLLEALRQLPDCRAEIFAASRYGDRYRGQLSIDAPASVRLMPQVTPTAIAAHYRRSRFVVLCLHRTGQSSAGFSSLLEAFAAGKAVIATDTPGMRECVRDGETGLLVRPHDSGDLKTAIERLLRDPALAHRMGQAGRRLVEERYRQDEAAERLRKALRDAWHGP